MTDSILIMLDNVLNNFSQMLEELGVDYNPEKNYQTERRYLDVFYDDAGNLTKIGKNVFGETQPRREGIDFVNLLYKSGKKIILCTSRDIRLCYDVTKTWLCENDVNYNYLFTATAPAGLCIDMDIPFMVYNLPQNGHNRITLVKFTPDEDGKPQPVSAGVFETFEELNLVLNGICSKGWL